MNNKFLFLDIDGVLNSDRTIFAHRNIVVATKVEHDILLGKSIEDGLDHTAIKLLQNCQSEIGFKIVISSSWRGILSLSSFHKMFAAHGWDTTDIIIGKTPRRGVYPFTRGNEIQDWLDTNGGECYNYVILDDDRDMLDTQQSNFVHVDATDGLLFSHVKMIYKILNTTPKFFEGI